MNYILQINSVLLFDCIKIVVSNSIQHRHRCRIHRVHKNMYTYMYKHIFFFRNLRKALEKLVTAQDTSNIENDVLSSDELKEKKKQRRRINAKKCYSSSSDEEKENEPPRARNKVIPSLPQVQDFISSIPIMNKVTKNKNILDQEPSTSQKNNNGK